MRKLFTYIFGDEDMPELSQREVGEAIIGLVCVLGMTTLYWVVMCIVG